MLTVMSVADVVAVLNVNVDTWLAESVNVVGAATTVTVGTSSSLMVTVAVVPFAHVALQFGATVTVLLPSPETVLAVAVTVHVAEEAPAATVIWEPHVVVARVASWFVVVSGTTKPPAGALPPIDTVTVDTLAAASTKVVGAAVTFTSGRSLSVIVLDATAGLPTTYPAPATTVTVAVTGPSKGAVLLAEIVHVAVV